ncbi:MAG: DUF1844 domain-containing protein [Thermodesulfobacteriota bacterium]|nr:DUF1844 domain-containing protein [Thermodesulfobacteriota bacterium]
MGEDTHEKDFVIKDKRIFDESGEARQPEPEKTEEKITTEEKQIPKREAEEEKYLPEINFSSFVLSLSTSALYQFGDFPDPVSKKTEKNLSAAKQTIDILGMLKEKTEGNLNDKEKELLDGMLFELRVRYVKEKGD